MKKVSELVGQIIGNGNPLLLLHLELKNFWNEIVGQDLIEFTKLISVNYSGKKAITVVIGVLSSAIISAKFYENNIKNNIKNNLNMECVHIVFKHLSELKDAA
ncbi:hypothetical protein FACS1894113_3070 [Alphaproteobacteria bacterium]|nr:hypothetical protein FACS1894113_3070 [Alphaproteobacteria bacterium]